MQRSRAHLAGLIYLLYFLAAIIAQALATRGLVHWGHAINLLAYAFYVALTLLLYRLFKGLNHGLSLFAAIISLIGCTIGVFAVIHPAQHHHPADINPLLFFGGYCLCIGTLIIRSTFLPHFIGWLMALAGIGWFAFLFPIVVARLALPIEVLGILAEAVLMFWLLIRGVDTKQWQKQFTAGR
jgi:hypothetical protein